MFIYTQGIVKEIHKSSIYLETDSGIAFEIFVIFPTLYEIESKKKLYLFNYLKDERISLYGFDNEEDLKIFKLLNEVNGIGPKTSLQILKNIERDRLINYISEAKIDELSKINGIGSKAERLIADLKNKIKIFKVKNFKYEDVENALLSLGYNSRLIFKVLSELPQGLKDEEALKLALKELKNGK